MQDLILITMDVQIYTSRETETYFLTKTSRGMALENYRNLIVYTKHLPIDFKFYKIHLTSEEFIEFKELLSLPAMKDRIFIRKTSSFGWKQI